MKHVAVAAVALIVGLMMGGLGPRAEVRSLEAELADATRQDCRGQVGRDLALLLGQGRDTPRARPSPQQEAIERPRRIAEENPEAVAEVERMEEEAEELAEEVSRDLEDLEAPDEEQLALAKTALDLRRAQSRAALVEDTDPTDEQLEGIDEAYAEMNDVLVDLSTELVDMLASEQEPTRRDAMEFAADALDAMLAAEQSVEGLLDAEQRGALEEDALNPFNYIDPDIVDTLEGLGELEL